MLDDVIWAIASPPGSGQRGVIRISGPAALEVAGAVVSDDLPAERTALETMVAVGSRQVAALVLVMPGPASFTGEDVVELHLPGSPLLCELVGRALEQAGARLASPGEFSRRAFESGRIDLSEAEAVMDLIHAVSIDEHRAALDALRGGLSQAVESCRARLQDALALLEAGLDFAEDETGAVDEVEWLPAVEEARSELQRLHDGLPAARPGGELLLIGPTNAGKSSLCNALLGEERVLVADLAGTTRDLIAVELAPGLTLCDAPGDLADGRGDSWDRAALRLRAERAQAAGGALLVVDPTLPSTELPDAHGLPLVALVQTRADLLADPPRPGGLPDEVPVFRVSNHSGAGIEELRAHLLRCARGGAAAGRSRVKGLLELAVAALDRAGHAAEEGSEVAAYDLGEALLQLDAVHGRSSPEDLLDRIFGRFCLGK